MYLRYICVSVFNYISNKKYILFDSLLKVENVQVVKEKLCQRNICQRKITIEMKFGVLSHYF